MICPFILHYIKKDMIKIGAHCITTIASATALQIYCSLHSTPFKEDKHGNLSTMRNTGKNPSVVCQI